MVLAEEGLVPPGVPLTPSLELAYQRVTLADLDAGTRVTLDAGRGGTGTPSTVTAWPALTTTTW